MRSGQVFRWTVFLCLAALLAALAPVAKAAPLPQGSDQSDAEQEPTLTIFAIGFVDVFGGDDPDCPGCDGEFQPEDEDFANDNPLPQLEFVVYDDGGVEIARATTDMLATLQRAMIEVPELLDGETYTLELASAPAGWELCANESASRELTLDDFQLGNTREDFHFWQGCDAAPTATPPDGPTAEPTEPGGPTAEPTEEGNGGDDGEDEDKEEAKTGPALGSIRGLVFVDNNQDGTLGSDEPGMGGVNVHLRGGGLDLVQSSSGTGQFSFDGLGAGEYDVFIEVGSEWRVTTPSLFKVTVKGNTVMGIDFGLVRSGAAKPSMAGKAERMPATGIADLPKSNLLGIVALILGVAAVLGFSFERRQRR